MRSACQPHKHVLGTIVACHRGFTQAPHPIFVRPPAPGSCCCCATQELENQALDLKAQLVHASEHAATHATVMRAKDGKVAKMAVGMQAALAARDTVQEELAHATGELKVG